MPETPMVSQPVQAGVVAGSDPICVHVVPPSVVVSTSVQVGCPQFCRSTSAQPWVSLTQVRSSTCGECGWDACVVVVVSGGWVVVLTADVGGALAELGEPDERAGGVTAPEHAV